MAASLCDAGGGLAVNVSEPLERRREAAIEAPQSNKIWRVGCMINGARGSPEFDAVRKGLADLGYTEGKNILLEPRFAEHQLDRHPPFAADLVRLGASKRR